MKPMQPRVKLVLYFGIAVLLLETAALIQAAPPEYQASVLNDGPVLYYQFNEVTSVATNYGSLGASYDATYLGTPQRGAPTSGGDAGVAFNSSDDYLESGAVAPPSLSGNPTFTAEAVFFVPTNGTATTWAPFLHWGVSQGINPTMRSVYFSFSNGDPTELFAGFYNGGLQTVAPVLRGQWHHFVWVRQGGGAANVGTTVYVDGASVSLENDPDLPSDSATPNVTNTVFRVDRAQDLTRFFTGTLDEVALYDRMLTPTEVIAHYTALNLNPPECSLVVTNTNDSGPGSLRNAILCANTNPGLNTITFNIPPNDGTVKTIFVTNNLTSITGPTIIDGYTQPGSSSNTLATGNNAVLLIEVTSTNNSQGISITGGGCTVRGLVLNGFYNTGFQFGNAILIQAAATNNIIEGNFIGTDATGTNESPHVTFVGVNVNSPGNRIGGPLPGARNVIGGCRSHIGLSSPGIVITGSAGTNNTIQGNYIGTDKTGTKAIGNDTGIAVNSSLNQIGGATAGAGNLISGNNGGGIDITSASTNVVEGNLIGLDATGASGLPNGNNGIFLNSANSTRIGGTTAGARNVISGNANRGITMSGSVTNSVLGNFIGTDATGSNAVPNALGGIHMDLCTGVFIGGSVAGAGNVIAGNSGSGISFTRGSVLQIDRNFIGTDLTGTMDLGNTSHGIDGNSFVSKIDIGVGAPNTIAFNGTGLGHAGVALSSGAISNIVTGNLIYSNAGPGVYLFQGATQTRISDNSIFDNGHLGIILGGSGFPLPNDSCDPDTGNNDQQNYPVLTSASNAVSSTVVQGTLDSASNTTFMVEFFANPVCDASGFGEGKIYLAFTNVTTGANCTNAFTFITTTIVPVGQFITATATDPDGNTSEFSACRQVTGAVSNQPPVALCRNVTDAANASCEATVTAAQVDNGSFDPDGTITNRTLTPPGPYPKGNTPVTLTVSDNLGATASCNATVTVVDQTSPTINCAPTVVTNAPPGATNLVVTFPSPVLSDNCPGASAGCSPASGSLFPLGTTLVTCTATDSSSNSSTCSFTVTVNATTTNTPPVALCRNVTTNAGANCQATVSAADVDNGSFDSNGTIVSRTLSPPGPYAKGTNLVSLTLVDNLGASNSCTASIVVLDAPPPSLTCPTNIVVTAGQGATNAVVNYTTPSAADNCPGVTVNCAPPSGSVFALGTTAVRCVATDAAGNTNACTFTVTVNLAAPIGHDLAVVKTTVPKTIVLSNKKPSFTRFVIVQIQNRGPQEEVINSLFGYGTNLVTLTVESLGACPDLIAVLHDGPPQRTLPVTLKPKQKLNIFFDLTFTTNCVNNPLKGPGYQDYRYVATVHTEAIDGTADTFPADDICPRGPLGAVPLGTGTTIDKGCGGKNPDGTRGADILTDVEVK